MNVRVLTICLAGLACAGAASKGPEARTVGAEPQTEFEMRPRPTDEAAFPDYVQYLVEVAEPRTPEERAKDAEIKARYDDGTSLDRRPFASG